MSGREPQPDPSPGLAWSLRWLRSLAWLVPGYRRDDWLEEWGAELHTRHHADGRPSGLSPSTQISEAWGALPDALCLRTQSWRFDAMANDIAYALRSMRRRPGFALTAVLTLALGIGATTAIFSVIDTVLLRPLPYDEPERLVHLWETNPDRGWTEAEVAPANFLDWKEQASSYTHLAAYSEYPTKAILGGGDEPSHVRAASVSGDFFEVLRVEPILGRTFRTGETWHDGTYRVLLSNALWRTRFGSDPDIVGSHLPINGSEALVVGVLPDGFAFHGQPVDLWTPFGWGRSRQEQVSFRRAHLARAIGRLAPGVTLTEAREELDTIAARLEQEYPETNTRMGAGIGPLHDWIVGDTRLPLLVLLGAVALVLLIACANVANLLLARTTTRVRELAVRRALGAGRGRLIRQLLTENALLAAMAGLLGLGVAAGGLRLLVAVSPDDIPRLHQVSLDGRVLAFTVLLAALTTLFFGLAPAVLGVRSGATLGTSRAGTASPRESRFRSALVVAEVALALVVVVATGLLARSLWNLYDVDPGFESEHVLVAEIGLPSSFYDEAAAVDGFFDRLTRRAESLPGVESAATTGMLPIASWGWSGDLSVEGRGPGEHATEVRFAQVAPDYFETLQTPVLSGREFRESDGADAPQVAVINESMRRLMFPDQDPLGVRLASVRDPDESSRWATVVGVVRDIRQFGVDEAPRPQIFFPLAQRSDRVRSLLVRTGGDPLVVAPALRSALAEIDPRVPLGEVRTLSGVVERSLARERFVLAQLVAFGAVALLLASVGTWGVLTYNVSQRRTEIGVRMAVGADRGEVVRLVLGQGMRLVTLGFVVGLVGAVAVTRFLESLLFELDALDPATFAGTGLLLAAVGLVACLLPARAAARTDPTASLRAE